MSSLDRPDVPGGDPQAIRDAANRLQDAHIQVTLSRSQMTTAVDGLQQHWIGRSANAFVHTHHDLGNYLEHLSTAQHEICETFKHFAASLEHAQHQCVKLQGQWDTAQRTLDQKLQEVTEHENDELHMRNSNPSDIISGAKHRREDLTHHYDLQKKEAHVHANHHFDDVHDASVRAISRLQEIARTIRIDEKESERLALILGGAGAALTGLAAVGVRDAVKDYKITQAALASKDASALGRLVEANREAMEAFFAVVKKYGYGSKEVLDAWVEFEGKANKVNIARALEYLVGADKLPGLTDGGFALSALGKLGVATAVVGDIYAIYDPKTTHTDRVLSEFNLDALGEAVATGGPEILDGSLVASLVAVNGTVDWIPGLGLVVFGATTVLLSLDYLRQHVNELEKIPGFKELEGVNADFQKFITSSLP